MIDDKKLQVSFFFIFFGIISVLTFLVYQPFFQAIALAAILTVLLNPLYKKNCALFGERRGISALFVILVTSVFIAVPLYFLGAQVFKESQALYAGFHGDEAGSVARIVSAIERPIQEIYPNFSFNFGAHFGDFADIVSRNTLPLVSGTALALFEMFIVVLSLFFFLKDGDYFISGFMKLSPLDDEYDREILHRLEKTIDYVLGSVLLIGIIQGFLVGIGFLIFGVPKAALWGTLATLVAPIPGLGTSVVLIPAVFYLLFVGNNSAALGLFLWSMLIVGLIDNFLTPVFYNRGIQVHPLFVLFAVLGGISFFGPLGFLFGPVILSAFLALLHIYRIFILEEKEEI
jgi:predicted PurR-regulated permease PerM